MTDERKKKYVYLLIGYLGFLLLGLAIVRYISIIQDTLGLTLAVFGYLFLVMFFQFAENKLGVTTKEKIVCRSGLIVFWILLLFFII